MKDLANICNPIRQFFLELPPLSQARELYWTVNRSNKMLEVIAANVQSLAQSQQISYTKMAAIRFARSPASGVAIVQTPLRVLVAGASLMLLSSCAPPVPPRSPISEPPAKQPVVQAQAETAGGQQAPRGSPPARARRGG